jgi:hypothetical protein
MNKWYRKKTFRTLMTKIKKNIVLVENEIIVPKKGRKPKGGKIIIQHNEKNSDYNQVTNIILHLKCTIIDLDSYNTNLNKLIRDPLQYDSNIPMAIQSYSNDNYTIYSDTNESVNLNENNAVTQNDNRVDSDIDSKLKNLKISLYQNTLSNKKSDCFWCTYQFNNELCCIPKYDIDDKIFGYGSFCSPECAAAHLMKENIDDSTKFERYHLLNQIYSKIFDYKINIKPAPNPYYTLDKYYGNMSIDEYRKLSKSQHLLITIDKPLTRLLPELHEDNDILISNLYGIGGGGNLNKNEDNIQKKQLGNYKVKRQDDKQKGPSKLSILKENFGYQ